MEVIPSVTEQYPNHLRESIARDIQEREKALHLLRQYEAAKAAVAAESSSGAEQQPGGTASVGTAGQGDQAETGGE